MVHGDVSNLTELLYHKGKFQGFCNRQVALPTVIVIDTERVPCELLLRLVSCLGACFPATSLGYYTILYRGKVGVLPAVDTQSVTCGTEADGQQHRNRKVAYACMASGSQFYHSRF
jgi:hypothetical protein